MTTGAQHRRGAPEDYGVGHQGDVAPPCPPLPPLYPHCMRHQEHRCLYSAQHQQQRCHERMGSTYGRGGPCPLPLPYQYIDGHASGYEPGPRDHSGHPAGHLVLKVVSEASAEPDKKVNFEVVSVDVRHGRFRKAVPRMPLFLSVFLCVINMLAPGVGTFLAAFTVWCGCKTEYDDKCTAFCYNILASILQIATALIVVGWVWSIMWGITFVSISFTKRDEDLIASL